MRQQTWQILHSPLTRKLVANSARVCCERLLRISRLLVRLSSRVQLRKLDYPMAGSELKLVEPATSYDYLPIWLRKAPGLMPGSITAIWSVSPCPNPMCDRCYDQLDQWLCLAPAIFLWLSRLPVVTPRRRWPP